MPGLYINETERAPAGLPNIARKVNASLSELSRQFHLFTLGPVYVGARLDTDLLRVFAEQENARFESVLSEQPFSMFRNLKEWDFMVQGIERSEDLGNRAATVQQDRMTERFSQFLQGWEFVRQPSRFYARIYSRPVQIIPPGEVRGTPVEVYLLMSNKGTQIVKGANPYSVEVDPLQRSPVVMEHANAVLDAIGGKR